PRVRTLRRRPPPRSALFPYTTLFRSRERHCHLHLAGHRRIVERIGVADAFAGPELQIAAAERMAVAGGEIAERHPVTAALRRLEVVDGTRVAVRRQPLGHGVRLDEGAIDLVGAGCEDTVQAYGARHGCLLRVATIRRSDRETAHATAAIRSGRWQRTDHWCTMRASADAARRRRDRFSVGLRDPR